MEYERIIMSLIVHGGNARSNCLKALECAQNGDMIQAETLFKSVDEDINKAHEIQTKLIQAEINGEKNEITLLLIHAQDHLMNAMTVRDLALMMFKWIKNN